jgi:hypothetical protein
MADFALITPIIQYWTGGDSTQPPNLNWQQQYVAPAPGLFLQVQVSIGGSPITIPLPFTTVYSVGILNMDPIASISVIWEIEIDDAPITNNILLQPLAACILPGPMIVNEGLTMSATPNNALCSIAIVGN